MKLIKLCGMLALGLLTLVGCGGMQTSIREAIPPASDKPTLAYFYTEN
jgi:hypothetical protein